LYSNDLYKDIVLNKSVFFKDSINSKILNYLNTDWVSNQSYKNLKKTNLFLFNFLEKSLENKQYDNLITHSDLDDNSRWAKRSFGKNSPLRLVKYPVSDENFSNTLFKLRFNDSESALKHKTVPNTTYLTLKQKRYKRRKKIPLYTKSVKTFDMNPITGLSLNKKSKISSKLFLKDNSLLIDNIDDSTRQYRMLKKNKSRNELIPVVYSKRLLRVKRTLVIPAHVNITAITNSYDVCHSWFIPGLGLKMDCVPGRATHHTFYVDNVGFYYGQCAEICGRYHHHMPIRVCALPFEHFLV